MFKCDRHPQGVPRPGPHLVRHRLPYSGTPIILHAGAVADGSGNEEWCGPDPVLRLLDRFPGLRLVIAHLGAPDHDAFVALAERNEGVWLDTAMVFTDPPYLGPSPLHLAERVRASATGSCSGRTSPPSRTSSQLRLAAWPRWASAMTGSGTCSGVMACGCSALSQRRSCP